MSMTQDEALRIRKLKAAKPRLYDMPAQEWIELNQKLKADVGRKRYVYIQLCTPLATPLELQQLRRAAGAVDIPPTLQVQTRPIKVDEPAQTIFVCQLERVRRAGKRPRSVWLGKVGHSAGSR
ncbi:MAG: hypothetical protein MMC33_000133 [Icmadophila ericetorum]|nr:hypothetical protein [Icmadophila ericetorum]